METCLWAHKLNSIDSMLRNLGFKANPTPQFIKEYGSIFVDEAEDLGTVTLNQFNSSISQDKKIGYFWVLFDYLQHRPSSLGQKRYLGSLRKTQPSCAKSIGAQSISSGFFERSLLFQWSITHPQLDIQPKVQRSARQWFLWNRKDIRTPREREERSWENSRQSWSSSAQRKVFIQATWRSPTMSTTSSKSLDAGKTQIGAFAALWRNQQKRFYEKTQRVHPSQAWMWTRVSCFLTISRWPAVNASISLGPSGRSKVWRSKWWSTSPSKEVVEVTTDWLPTPPSPEVAAWWRCFTYKWKAWGWWTTR